MSQSPEPDTAQNHNAAGHHNPDPSDSFLTMSHLIWWVSGLVILAVAWILYTDVSIYSDTIFYVGAGLWTFGYSYAGVSDKACALFKWRHLWTFCGSGAIIMLVVSNRTLEGLLAAGMVTIIIVGIFTCKYLIDKPDETFKEAIWDFGDIDLVFFGSLILPIFITQPPILLSSVLASSVAVAASSSWVVAEQSIKTLREKKTLNDLIKAKVTFGNVFYWTAIIIAVLSGSLLNWAIPS